jgi:hypothetical protein
MNHALKYRTEHKHEHLYTTLIELGGGKFAGVMPAFHDKHGKRIEPLVLFISPQSGSTLSLYVSQLSASAVRARIAESDAEFAAFQEKAVDFVFRNFAAKPIVTSQHVSA